MLIPFLTVELFRPFGAPAEGTNQQKSAMSLTECIQIALEHNLDIKIERYNPAIARNNLGLAYSTYEPSLSGGGLHSFDLSPGGIDQQNRPFSGTTTKSDFGRRATSIKRPYQK